MIENFSKKESSEDTNEGFLKSWGRRLALIASVSFLMSCDTKKNTKDLREKSKTESIESEPEFLSDEQVLSILQKQREIKPTFEAGFLKSTEVVKEPTLRDFFDKLPKKSQNFRITSANFSEKTQNIILYFRVKHLFSGLQDIDPKDKMMQRSILDTIEINTAVLRSVEEIKKATGYKFEFVINEELHIEDEALVADLLKNNPGELQSDYVRYVKGMIQKPTKEKFLNLFKAVTPARTLAIQDGLTILGSTTREAFNYYDPIYRKALEDNSLDTEEQAELKRLEDYREDVLLFRTQTRFQDHTGKIILMPFGGVHYFKNNMQHLLSRGGNLGLVEISPRPLDEILAKEQKD